MATLFVTGGAGFIGANLVNRVLATTDARVVVIDKLTYAANSFVLSEAFRNPRVEFVEADIADREAIAAVFDRHRPSVLLNLAAETHVDRSIDSAWPFIETNIVGTVVLLEEVRRRCSEWTPSEREAFRFVHISTDEVYGTLGSIGRFTETSPYSPNSPYAASKASADHLVRAYHSTYGLPTIVTNCSNNYGPFQHPEKLIPLMTLNALDAQPLPIYGDGQNVRDWLHVEDHCAALLLVAARGVPGSSYNIGASNECPNLRLVDLLCASLEQIVPASANAAMVAAGRSSYTDLKQFVPDRPGHDRRYAVDATKLRDELDWRPQHDFADGLRQTVRWYAEHRPWFEAHTAGYNRQRLGLGALAP
jgi:dTDP-glucose 4,6-dehydratase